jgi:signal transduction histidine kinase
MAETEFVQQQRSDERVNILIVDDQPEGRLALEAVLEDFGQHLVMAGSSREAFRHLLDKEFAVILLDVQMPEMDGFETAELIRSRARSRHTPIIFLTASHKSDAHMFKGYAAGAVDYLSKPFVPEILRSKVKVFVELHKKTLLLQAANRELENAKEELRNLNGELNSRRMELEMANKELEAFSYSVSHDLRAPLRHMNGFAEILGQHAARVLDEKGRRYLDTISKAAKQMGVLIDDLLAFSQIGRTDIRKVSINLNELVKQVLSDLKPDTEGRSIIWNIDDLPDITGDPSLLRLVLVNLIGNAIKYTRKRETTQIEIGSERNGAEKYRGITIFIKDNGAGFDMKYAEKLFGVFSRLHNATDFEGTGIGLANVRRIIARHGGSTWAEGEVNQGATFYFSLPA